MARPREHDSRSTTAIRLPPEMLEALRTAAKERGVSMNFLIHKAVEELLANLIPVAELRLTRPRGVTVQGD